MIMKKATDILESVKGIVQPPASGHKPALLIIHYSSFTEKTLGKAGGNFQIICMEVSAWISSIVLAFFRTRHRTDIGWWIPCSAHLTQGSVYFSSP